jgi:hypothetical protein
MNILKIITPEEFKQKIVELPEIDKKTIIHTTENGELPNSYKSELERNLSLFSLSDFRTTSEQRTMHNPDNPLEANTWERALNYENEFFYSLRNNGIIEERKSIIITPNYRNVNFIPFEPIKFNINQINRHPHFGSMAYCESDKNKPFVKVFYGDNEELLLNLETQFPSVIKNNGTFLVSFDLHLDERGNFKINNLLQNDRYTNLSIDDDEKFKMFVVGLRGLSKSILANRIYDKFEGKNSLFKNELLKTSIKTLRNNKANITE